MGQEVELRFLRNPSRAPHRLDQLARPGGELRSVGDTLAPLVTVPPANRRRSEHYHGRIWIRKPVAIVAAVPIDPSRLNAVGDLVVTEVDELRALADPVRLDLFDLVRREGPLAVEEACTRLGLSVEAASTHLRTLADAGLIDRDEDGEWSTEARGIYFEIPDEPEAQRAARELSNTMLVKYASPPAEWVRSVEPQLDVAWARAAGLFNARPELAPDELRRLQEDLERLLEPFVNRPAGERPLDAAPVRITAYFLPEPG
jgi:DNA-binding transcriptional ArsR family regulator